MTQLTPNSPIEPKGNPSQTQGFYARWRKQTYARLQKAAGQRGADILFLVPDLLALILRLIRDPRTPLPFKAQLVLATGYVLLPVDLVPEAFLGAAGLADDAVVMSIVLYRVLQAANQVDAALIRQHWPGNGDIIESIRQIVATQGELIHPNTRKAIGALFGQPKPDPDPVLINGNSPPSL